MRDTIVCDKVCLCVVWTSSLFCDKTQSSLVNETSEEGIYENWVPFGSIFRQIKGVQRHPLPAFAVFQVPTAHNSRYATVACFVVTCPELLQFYFGVAYSATLQHPSLRLQLFISLSSLAPEVLFYFYRTLLIVVPELATNQHLCLSHILVFTY